LQKYIEHNCRTTAKEKSRRNADAFSRAHEAAALIFRGRQCLQVQQQNAGPNNDNPNYIIQLGNVFGFIISIENVL